MLTWRQTISPTTVQVILIISDQDNIPALWETSFREKGFTTVCETPENAYQTCRLVDPAITVIDIHFSHEERLVFCSEVRSVTSGPILLLVPEYDGNQMLDIYNVGVDECLLKPINPTFLAVKAVSWLLRKRWLEYDTSLPGYTNS